MTKKRLRGAVVGYGFISGKGHIPAYAEREDVEIVAIADICAARRDIARENLPQANVYSDYQDLLAQETDLDFVDVSTPPCDHTEIALAALKKGHHVLCEKPLAPTLEQAKELLQTAMKEKRTIFPCHNYKHAPVVKAIQEIIDSGKIGKVNSVTLSTYRNTHAKGVTEWDTHWRRNHKTSGGGIAMDHGSHSFYLTFDWLGSHPSAITAKMDTLNKAYDTEDQYNAVLTFPTGTASVHLTWNAGVRKVMYTVQGEKGAITVDDDSLQLALMKKTSGPDVAQGAVTWEVEEKSISSHWMDASHVSWFNQMFDQFLNCIEKDDWVGDEARESYLCVQAIEKSYESAKNSCKEISLETNWSWLEH